MKNEPIVTVAGLLAFVTALLALLNAFNVFHLTDEQTAQILAFVAVAGPVVIALVARKFAFAPGSVVAYQNKSGAVVAGDASPIPTGTPVDVEPNGELGQPVDGPGYEDEDYVFPDTFADPEKLS
jgi:hypothetical protein